MATVTIRVARATHKRLQALAEKHELSIGEVVAEATRKLEDADFWAELDASYAELWGDPATAAELEAEQALWDGMLADGLEEYPYEGIEELVEKAQLVGVGRDK